MAQRKGAGSIQISKDKGHATEKNIQDGTSTLKDKKGNGRADSAADEGVKDHSGKICKISRIQAQRQYKIVRLTKEVHNHILEAFYKKKYLESIETNEPSQDQQQTNGRITCKHIKIGEVQYSQETNDPVNRTLTDVGNMGETMSKYNNAYNVHKFIEKCPFNPNKDGEDGISWQEMLIIYKLCGGKDMLNKPCNGAKKRASVLKQLEAFKKCAKSIINNGMTEVDQAMFKPNELKKARLENIGITSRVAIIKANVHLTKEAQTEIK